MKFFVIALVCLSTACLAAKEIKSSTLDMCIDETKFNKTGVQFGNYRSDRAQKCLAACVYKKQGVVNEDCTFNVAALDKLSGNTFSENYGKYVAPCEAKYQDKDCCEKIVAMEKCITSKNTK